MSDASTPTAVLEQTLATLTQQVRALVQENAMLRTSVTAAPTPPVATPPTPVAVPPAPAVVTEWGFVASDVDPAAGLAAAMPKAFADGGRWVRLWHSNFGTLSPGNVKAIAAAHAAGLKVILCLQPKDGEPRPLGVPDIAGFVTKNAASLKQVAYVEAGNELNLNQYRPDDLGGDGSWHVPYVRRWLKPLYTALAAVGVKTLCTSVTDTYHPDTYATQYDALRAAGASDCCDGLALHAYALPQYLPQLSALLAGLKAEWNQPVFVTECNVKTKGLTPKQWQQQFPAYLAVLRQGGVAAIAFYRGFAKPDQTWTWPVLFDAAGKPADAYGFLLGEVAKAN